MTVGDLRAKDLVMSGTKPCRGLTLLFQPGESAYHVCNLYTGEHVSLPPCAWANRALPDGPYVLSSTGLGFDPAAGEHVVVRLFEDWRKQQRCEMYGLRSGGWRPFAGRVPPHAAKGLNGRPPVFLDLDGGCFFYWHINTSFSFAGPEERRFGTPEPILSLSVGTGQFRWVRPPEERVRHAFHLAELNGDLCAVVDTRLLVEHYELWVRSTTAGSGSTVPSSWSLRCRIGLASLPRPMREALGRGFRVLPLGSSGGKILLATSRHEVYAYDPERNSVDSVFSMQEHNSTTLQL
uniref:F-box associated domain-containing protein n=1 Tax=Setaria italica TaxID=4555 RepID=K3YZF5_SETIT